MKIEYERVKNWIEEGLITIRMGPSASYFKSSTRDREGTPVVKIKNVGMGRILDDEVECIDKDTAFKLKSFRIKKSDILFVRKGNIDKHALVNEKEDGWIQGTDIVLLRINLEKINPQFLSYYFMTKKHRNAIKMLGVAEQSIMEALNKKNVNEIEVPTLERSEQDKIVDILKKYDAKIMINERIIENLNEHVEVTFHSMFSGKQRNCTLEQLTSCIVDGEHNYVKDDPEGNYFFLSCKNLKNDAIQITDNERRINKKDFEKIRKRTKLEKGDVLLGTVGKSGKIVLLDFEPENIEFQRSVAIIKPDRSKVSSEYLYRAMLDQKAEIVRLAHGSAQQFIRLSDLKRLELYFPTREELRVFNEKVSPLMALSTEKKKENIKLAELRNELIPKFMLRE